MATHLSTSSAHDDGRLLLAKHVMAPQLSSRPRPRPRPVCTTMLPFSHAPSNYSRSLALHPGVLPNMSKMAGPPPCQHHYISGAVDATYNIRHTQRERHPKEFESKSTARPPRYANIGVARASTGVSTAQTRELPHGLHAQLLPRHVGFIMDGNSRWAERMGLPRSEGHEAMARAWKEIVLLSNEWGIAALTAFFFSTENFGRSQVEVSTLMNVFERLVQHVCEDFVKYNIQARVIGDIKQLPMSLQYEIQVLEAKTSQNSGLKVSLAINYGGRYDIIQACKRIILNVQQGKLTCADVTQQTLDKELETSWLGNDQNLDLVIRTGGDQRISNFLLWQTAYSELMFLDQLWPEIDETIYANTLLSYQRCNRRFGKR